MCSYARYAVSHSLNRILTITTDTLRMSGLQLGHVSTRCRRTQRAISLITQSCLREWLPLIIEMPALTFGNNCTADPNWSFD